jgi:hypothetical protein
MLSASSSSSARRTRRLADRRTRRRPALVAASVALGVIVAASVTGTATAVQPQATGTTATYQLASYSTDTPATLGFESAATRSIAQQATTDADAAVTAAASVTADIAASGLDIGEPDPTVDTAGLESAVAQLREAAATGDPLLPTLTENVAALVPAIDERVTQLRGSLEGAKAKKAEEEAAAKAAAEAAEKAAEEAAAKAASSSGGSGIPASLPSGGGGSGDNSPAGAQASARGMLAGYGWGDDQFGCLVSLWNKESGWNYQAHNSSSGAHGIPQALPGSKMASAGADWQTNAATQVAWGLGYISGRYGNPCGAWSHSQSTGWY